MSASVTYPIVCRYTDEFEDFLENTGIPETLQNTMISDNGDATGVQIRTQPFISSMHIYDNGLFKSAYEQINNRAGQQYKELRIFSQRDANDIKSTQIPSYDYASRQAFGPARSQQ